MVMQASTSNIDTAVLIIGAGPTGLVLALWLTRLGVPVRIIDKSREPGLTSRAIAVQARTLEFYRQFGFVEEILEQGVKIDEIRFHKDQKLINELPLGDFGGSLSPYPFLLMYPQDEHERFLIKQLDQAGVTVERSTELTVFKETINGIEATIVKESKVETINALFLCGCDGAHSTVRHITGIGFPGSAYCQVLFLADVFAEGEIVDGKVHLCMSDQDFYIVLPIRHSKTLRLIGMVPKSCENKEAITFDDVSAQIPNITGLAIKQLNWFATYQVHHRVANSFQKGRAFLLGDAGHIHSPVGGQGMNTGIGDAINLSWKLADVLQGRASPELLQTYESERIAFARKLVGSTDQLFKFIANRKTFGRAWRNIVVPIIAPLLTKTHFGPTFLFRLISQIGINYRKSIISQGKVGSIHGGR